MKCKRRLNQINRMFRFERKSPIHRNVPSYGLYLSAIKCERLFLEALEAESMMISFPITPHAPCSPTFSHIETDSPGADDVLSVRIPSNRWQQSRTMEQL